MKQEKRLAASMGTVFMVLIMGMTVLYSAEAGVIKEPEPNMVEEQYVPLKKVKTIGADLGNDEFMFKPFSMTVDKANNLYVYDILQAKVLKFDHQTRFVTAFGRVGQGPGEFSGTGKIFPVFIKMGRDGNLYANDLRARKIIGFDKNGKNIVEHRYGQRGLRSPIVDRQGNIYIFSGEKNRIYARNQRGHVLANLNIEEGMSDYLFFKPGAVYTAFENPLDHMLVDLTADSTLLIYFQTSSTMMQIKKGDLKSKMKIWPRDALQIYRALLSDLLKRSKNMYRGLFGKLLVDEGDANLFYLQFGENKERGINALYELSLKGHLRQVFCADIKESSSFTRFEAVKSGLFYAIEGEIIAIYKKEDKK